MDGGCRHVMLNMQYRMHSDIAFCINRTFYEGNLRHDPSTLDRSNVLMFF